MKRATVFSQLILCAISVLLFGIIALSIGSDWLERFDSGTIHFVQGLEEQWLTKVMKFFTRIGSTIYTMSISIILFLLFFFTFHFKKQGVLLILSTFSAIFLNKILKSIFKRDRPDEHQLIDISGYSFPSSHAMMAFSLYIALTYILWGKMKTTFSRILLLVFASFMVFMISISRIYLGVHYPSDVIAGMATSGFLLSIFIFLFRVFRNKDVRKVE